MDVLEGDVEPAYKIETTTGRYFVKRDHSLPEFFPFYHQVAEQLNARGVRQARLHTRPGKGFLSPDGYAVYEWLPGRGTERPSERQFNNLMHYFARYNQALRELPVPAWVTRWKNPWDKADSLTYLLDHFAQRRPELHLPAGIDPVVDRVLAFLEQTRPDLEVLPKQLVHGDVGPGNILYDGQEVVAIVDFTPYAESHLYSLCVCLYWHCVYFQPGFQPDYQGIIRSLRAYAAGYPLLNMEKALFPVLFAKAAARMFFVLLIFNLGGERSFDSEAITESATILGRVLDEQHEFARCILAAG